MVDERDKKKRGERRMRHDDIVVINPDPLTTRRGSGRYVVGCWISVFTPMLPVLILIRTCSFSRRRTP